MIILFMAGVYVLILFFMPDRMMLSAARDMKFDYKLFDGRFSYFQPYRIAIIFLSIALFCLLHLIKAPDAAIWPVIIAVPILNVVDFVIINNKALMISKMVNETS